MSMNAAHLYIKTFARKLFAAGWDAHANAKLENQKKSGKKAATLTIPAVSIEMLRRGMLSAYRETRNDLIGRYSEYPHNGLSIDGVKIANRKFLNVDIVNTSSRVCPFTYDFLVPEGLAFDTEGFVEALRGCLVGLGNCGICVAGVTSDGARFQRKGLNWRDKMSIQYKYPKQFKELLFVPCVCHRLQLALKDLYGENFLYQERIKGIRHAAIELRKPETQMLIGRTCPSHISTRWIYDYPILNFIVSNLQDIRNKVVEFEGPSRDTPLLPMLQKIFTTVRILEGDSAAVGRVFPVVDGLCECLHGWANMRQNPPAADSAGTDQLGDYVFSDRVRGMFRDCANFVRDRVLNTTDNLFQLAYVMTPEGRARVRKELIAGKQLPVPVDEGAQSIPSSSAPIKDPKEEYDAEMTEIPSLDELVKAGWVDNDDDMESEEAILVAGNDDDDEEDEYVDKKERKRRLADPEGLAAGAEKGLRLILEQFKIEGENLVAVMGAYQSYTTDASEILPIKPDPNKIPSVYSWAAAPNTYGWVVLANIGMRLAVLPCSEAISERTNSQMRRLLSPYRLRMGKEILLARMVLSKHGGDDEDPESES
jgi:hypothetical protein